MEQNKFKYNPRTEFVKGCNYIVGVNNSSSTCIYMHVIDVLETKSKKEKSIQVQFVDRNGKHSDNLILKVEKALRYERIKHPLADWIELSSYSSYQVF